MKDTTTLLVLMIAGVVTGVAASVAYAEAPASASAPAGPSQAAIEQHAGSRAPVGAAFDANHDGRLDCGERAALHSARGHGTAGAHHLRERPSTTATVRGRTA
jgi:hypothetical protein